MLVAGGWWVVMVPAQGRDVPAIAEGDDLPQASSGAWEAVASGRPAVVAGSPVAPAASSASGVLATERCGVDDGPQTAPWTPPETDEPILPPPPIPIRGALPAWVATQARVAASLRASTDPYDQAVADVLNVGDMRTGDGVVEALVQRALATTDARVYQLALSACQRRGFVQDGPKAPASCGALSAAHWAALAPDNGVPWMAAMGEAVTADDARAERAAFDGLVRATHFDGRAFAPAAAIGVHAATQAGEEAAVADLQVRGFMSGIVMATISPAMQSCKAALGVNAQRVQQCLRIADGLYESGDDMMLKLQGGSLRFQLTGDPTRRDTARAESRRLGGDFAAAETTDCGKLRLSVRYLTRAGQVGELAARRELAAASAAP